MTNIEPTTGKYVRCKNDGWVRNREHFAGGSALMSKVGHFR
jgi:hypothetical protein